MRRRKKRKGDKENGNDYRQCKTNNSNTFFTAKRDFFPRNQHKNIGKNGRDNKCNNIDG